MITLIDRIDLSERRVTHAVEQVSQRVARLDVVMAATESRLQLVERLVFAMVGLMLTAVVVAILRLVVVP